MTVKSSVDYFDTNYKEICEKIKISAEKSGRKYEDIILLAATKTVCADLINYAIDKGIKYTGDNKVQELLEKEDSINFSHKHFIGHLQTNKVKDIINRVEMIESVDSLKLAKEISKHAIKNNKIMDILLEVNIGNEESKYGFTLSNICENINEISKLEGIKIRGLMAIPPFCENGEDNRKYFKEMYKLFVDIKGKKIDNSSIDILSMGMSNDYDVAIEEGANLVRIGTSLFGKRNYN